MYIVHIVHIVHFLELIIHIQYVLYTDCGHVHCGGGGGRYCVKFFKNHFQLLCSVWFV